MGLHGAAVGHAFVVHQRREVVPDRGAELGLVVEQFEHLHVGRKAGGEALVGRPRHAARRGTGFQFGQAGGEAGRVGRVGGMGRSGKNKRKPQEGRLQSPVDFIGWGLGDGSRPCIGMDGREA